MYVRIFSWYRLTKCQTLNYLICLLLNRPGTHVSITAPVIPGLHGVGLSGDRQVCVGLKLLKPSVKTIHWNHVNYTLLIRLVSIAYCLPPYQEDVT